MFVRRIIRRLYYDGDSVIPRANIKFVSARRRTLPEAPPKHTRGNIRR